MKHLRKTKLEIYADTIRMRESERNALRERLVSYIEFHPLIAVDEVVAPGSRFQFFTTFVSSFSDIKMMSRVTVATFAVVLAISVPAIAERTLPGDVLYPVKVHINEEVKAKLQWTATEKVAWEVERVERRIAEARLLAKEGKLTDEAEASIAATVKEHTDNAAREIETLRTTDADEAAVAQVSVESALDVQSAVLSKDSDSADEGVHIEDIADVVNDARNDLEDRGTDTVAISYPRLSGRVEFETTRMREFLSSISSSVSAEEKADIERRALDVERAIVVAREAHEKGDDNAAITTLRSILSDTQKLIVFMTDLDVRSSVQLETLIPKKLTDEERGEGVVKALKILKERDLDLRQDLLQVSETERIEQVMTDLDAFNVLIGAAETANGEKNFDEAEKQVMHARRLASDISDFLKESIKNTGTTTAETE